MQRVKNFFKSIGRFFNDSIWYTITFAFSLIIYLVSIFCIWIGDKLPNFLVNPVRPFFAKMHLRILRFNRYDQNTIGRMNIIEIAFRNMRFKKTRTLITVGGMAVGISAIVFLVSLGYGFQELVISRVARLDEMKQTDISPQAGSKLKINDESMANLKNIDSVEEVVPLIAVAGKVNFRNSATDVVVYGTTSSYFKNSAIKAVKGNIFENNELTIDFANNSNENQNLKEDQDDKNVVIEHGGKIGAVSFSIEEDGWVRVREGLTTDAKILGYTKRANESQIGEEFYGDDYEIESEENSKSDVGDVAEVSENEKKLGKWIYSQVLLWDRENCQEDNADCEGGKYLVMRDESGDQKEIYGYFAELGIVVDFIDKDDASVEKDDRLGEKERKELFLATGIESEDIDDDTLASLKKELGLGQEEKIKKVDVFDGSKKQAVVNRSMLSVLGINEEEAVGKKFETSFFVTGDLLEGDDEKIESNFTEYEIIGIIPGEETPVFYVPFIDLRSLGIVNYSQAKLIVNEKDNLAKTRKKVEAMGFDTQSVVDTVSQINSLFATARLILALIGTVALVVASMGMFNTLTVSLLEKTREVGLMKAMGMRSKEVKELFLTESMIMGFFGGILGILIGFGGGVIIGVILSTFTLIQGEGIIDVAYLPTVFIIFILFLSLIVGLITGVYPAKRATKISALNALRYE